MFAVVARVSRLFVVLSFHISRWLAVVSPPSCRMRGVTKTTNSVLMVVSLRDRNNPPNSGKSPKNGILPLVFLHLVERQAADYDGLAILHAHRRIAATRRENR